MYFLLPSSRYSWTSCGRLFQHRHLPNDFFFFFDAIGIECAQRPLITRQKQKKLFGEIKKRYFFLKFLNDVGVSTE